MAVLDSFTVADGSNASTVLWTETDASNLCTIQSNRLVYSSTSGGSAGLVLNNSLVGDFEITLDLGWVSALDGSLSFGLNLGSDSIKLRYFSGGYVYFERSPNEQIGYNSNLPKDTVFRLSRTGNVTTASYWSGAGWLSMTTGATSYDSGAALSAVPFISISSSGVSDFYVDDLDIVSGTLASAYIEAEELTGTWSNHAWLPALNAKFSFDAVNSVLNTPTWYTTDKNVNFNCLVSVRADDSLRRAALGVPLDAVEINGYVFPYSLVGKFTLTPDYTYKVVDTLTGVWTLSAIVDIGSLISSVSTFSATFSLSADVDISRVKVENNASNWVAWSKIGDITIGMDLTNDSGFKPMSWKGSILNVLQLGNSAVLYGTGGVTIMFPVSSPIPTFGFRGISSIGLSYKLSVAGDTAQHFFISSRRELCRLTEKGLEVLGFEEFLSSLDIETVLVFDSIRRRLYISDGVVGFTYTTDGLGGGFTNITGVYTRDYKSFLVFNSAVSYVGFEFITDIITLKSRLLKTISKISISTEISVPIYVSIGYRIHASDDWSWTVGRLFNYEGIATVAVSGIEFQIKIYTETYEEGSIDNLSLRFKIVDKRHRFEYNPNALYAGGNKKVVPSEV